MFEYTGHEGHLPSADGGRPQSTEPKVEEKRSYRCSPAMEEHLNSCLHLQTQDAKHHTCLTIRDRVLFTKEPKPQSNNKTSSSSSTPQASCPEVRPATLDTGKRWKTCTSSFIPNTVTLTYCQKMRHVTLPSPDSWQEPVKQQQQVTS